MISLVVLLFDSFLEPGIYAQACLHPISLGELSDVPSLACENSGIFSDRHADYGPKSIYESK